MLHFQLLDHELDATRRVTRPFVPQGDHFGDLQRERQILEDSSQVINPVIRRSDKTKQRTET